MGVPQKIMRAHCAVIRRNISNLLSMGLLQDSLGDQRIGWRDISGVATLEHAEVRAPATRGRAPATRGHAPPVQR